MTDNALDNPLWSSLTGRHAAFASGTDRLKMYPPEMVPFAAIPIPDAELDDAMLRGTMLGRTSVYFVGAQPSIVSSEYKSVACPNILQMVRTQGRSKNTCQTSEFRTLEAADIPAMLELTARVYPAYFRARTIEMGQYVGVFQNGALVSMAGLRMAPDGYREISGVCTDAAYTGRGYAGMLCEHLCSVIRSEGDTPMLHLDLDNAPARRLYEALGFEARGELPMSKLVPTPS